MTFLHPWLLACLPACVAWGVWEWRRRGREVAFPFDDASPAPRPLLGSLLRVAQLLPPLLAAWTVVLLAGPQEAVNGPNERMARNVHFLLDGSGSMLGRFGNTTRTLAAADAMIAFTKHRKGDAFALTLYANRSVTWIPLTKDVKQFEVAKPFVHPSVLPGPLAGDTLTGRALASACDDFADVPPGERLIILLTDGFAGDLDERATNEIAGRLRSLNVAVYTVLFAGEQPPADAARINELTGGRLLTAEDPDALAAVFERIDRMAQSTDRPTSPVLKDRFLPAALILLATLATYATALFGLRFTPW